MRECQAEINLTERHQQQTGPGAADSFKRLLSRRRPKPLEALSVSYAFVVLFETAVKLTLLRSNGSWNQRRHDEAVEDRERRD